MFVSYAGDAKISGNFADDIQVKNTNRLHSAVAGCDQVVQSGAWYFETRCVSGCAIVGWASASYKKHLTSGNTGEVFYVDFNKGQIFGGPSRIKTGHVQVNPGDIIGSLIDFNKRCVSFSFNGEFVSEMCIRGLDFGRGGYHPLVELRAGCAACISVVQSSFIAALPKDSRAYGNVGDKETSETVTSVKETKSSSSAPGPSLSDIFDKFTSERSPNKCNEDELLELFKAVGEESEADPIAFVLLWFVNKDSHEWEVSRDNFVKAFTNCGCKSLDDISRVLRKEVNGLLTHKSDSWPSFYTFVFHLLPEPSSRKVNAEKAAGVWEVLGFKKWKFFSQWVDFITEQQRERDEEMKEAASEEKDNPLRQQRGRKRNDPALIGLDIWESLPRFVSQFPQSLDSYDMDDLSYNTLFSEFVEKVRGQ